MHKTYSLTYLCRVSPSPADFPGNPHDCSRKFFVFLGASEFQSLWGSSRQCAGPNSKMNKMNQMLGTGKTQIQPCHCYELMLGGGYYHEHQAVIMSSAPLLHVNYAELQRSPQFCSRLICRVRGRGRALLPRWVASP